MKAKNLHQIWSASDNSRLTSQEYSLQLPVHVAAKIQALCEIYPRRSKTEIIADLLATALDEVELGFSSEKGAYFCDDDNGEALFKDVGLATSYRESANKHYQLLEQELGNKTPEDLFVGPFLIKDITASK